MLKLVYKMLPKLFLKANTYWKVISVLLHFSLIRLTIHRSDIRRMMKYTCQFWTGSHFYPPTERFGGYSDRPGVRLSVRPSVDETLCGP